MPIARNSVMTECRARMLSWLILIAVFAAVVPAGCGRKTPAKPAPKPAPTAGRPAEHERKKIEAKFEGARVTWDDDQGKRLWEAGFRSATAAEADGSARVELSGVEAVLYRDGEVTSRMVAPRVVADSARKEIRASGGVKVTSLADGSTTAAEEMVWKPKENKLVGNGGVRMDKGNIHIRARSITTDTALKKAKLSNAEAIL